MSTSICTICLEPLVRQDCNMVCTVPCGHAYHEGCLKKWAKERLNEEEPEILCPVCNTTVTNVVQIFLSTKTGVVDDSLSDKELETWRHEYDNDATHKNDNERLQLHAKVLASNKKVIDEIFEKQKILETYEQHRGELDTAKTENAQLRKELFQQIMKHEQDVRRMEHNKKLIQEVLERNEKALVDLKACRDENLDLKRELLKSIMTKQQDMKKLAASKQALTTALENQEAALNELSQSRSEVLQLKKELVEHLHHHKTKMEQLQTHKESLSEIVMQHSTNVQQLESVRTENFRLKEELVQALMQHQQDSTRLAQCEGWLQVLKEEVETFEDDRAALKLVRTENHRLGSVVQERHKAWLQARNEHNQSIHDGATRQMNWLLTVGQVGLLGLAIHSFGKKR